MTILVPILSPHPDLPYLTTERDQTSAESFAILCGWEAASARAEGNWRPEWAFGHGLVK
jgi:hypothetical protein